MNIGPYSHIAFTSCSTTRKFSMSSPDHYWRVTGAVAPLALLELRNMCSDEGTLKKEINEKSFPLLPFSSCCIYSPFTNFLPSFFFFFFSPSDRSLHRDLERWIQEKLKVLSDFFSPPPQFTPGPRNERLWGSWSLLFLLLRKEGGAGWGCSFPPRFFLLLLLSLRPPSRRASWGSRCYWLSWWRCHQSQMGGWGSGKGQSKRQGSEREGPRAGTWEAPPAVLS